MAAPVFDIRKTTDGVVFKIFVQPRSSKNIIVGVHGDALKIKLTAPPVEGAANKACIRFLSKSLNIPKSNLEIISGQTNRTKRVLIISEDEYEKDELAHRITLLADR